MRMDIYIDWCIIIYMRELKIIKKVCEDHGVSVYELCGAGRRQKIIDARIDVSHKLRDMGLSPQEIGYVLGGRDRKTITNLLGKKNIHRVNN